MNIKNFWDIKAWQEARILTSKIYNITNANPKFVKDYNLCRQVQRAAVSIMANIAEGFARKSDNEFARFLNIGLASNTELQSHFFVALDLNYLKKDEFDDLFNRSKQIEKLINSFISYLKNTTCRRADL